MEKTFRFWHERLDVYRVQNVAASGAGPRFPQIADEPESIALENRP